jgi:hypothetical protein
MRFAGILLFAAAVCFGQDYDGPIPPKSDVPYLKHADRLIELEAVEAAEETKRDDITYVIPGVSSPAKTPLAEPIFILQSQKLNPERIELFRLDVKNGRREITINQKRRRGGPRPLRIQITRLAQGLFRIEASETLENGQYSLSPNDSNKAYCFEVY